MIAENELDKFRIFDKESGLQTVGPAFDIVLYTNKKLSKISSSVLHAYDSFLKYCPAENLRWYCTENMRRHKPVNSRAFGLLRGWLKKGAPKRDVINIEITSAEEYANAAEFGFWVYGDERSGGYQDDAGMVRLVFPAEWGINRSDEMLNVAVDLCNNFPFQSGHAGYVLQTTRYRTAHSEKAAWRLASRYHGLDIKNELRDRLAVANDGIKGVNWLTMLCADFVDRLGGQDRLRNSLIKAVDLVSVQGGLILKAGQSPVICDLNKGNKLPSYQSVYKAVKVMQIPTIDRYGSFDLPGDASSKTDAWLQRYEK